MTRRELVGWALLLWFCLTLVGTFIAGITAPRARAELLSVQIDTTGALGVTQCYDGYAVVWVTRPRRGQSWNVDAAHEVAHLRQCFTHTPAWWDSMTATPASAAVLEYEAAIADHLAATFPEEPAP